MQRRVFVRLVGGGVVAAAATTAVGSLSGCTAGMPDVAVQAWSTAGQESDLRRWILSYALLAPHSHNLQSWLVDLRQPDEILLHCDTTRLLPQTDPLSRQIMMSQGSFIELACMAARERGYRPEVALFPQGVFDGAKPDQRPVARIRLVDDAQQPKDRLFAQITQRRTNRSLYAPERAVPAAAVQAMAAAIRIDAMPGAPEVPAAPDVPTAPHAASAPAAAEASAGLRFGFVGADNAAALQQHRDIANQAWKIELQTPGTFEESLHVMRVGADEVAQHRDGLVILDPMVVWLDRLGLFDRSKAPAPDSFAVTGQIKDFAAKMVSTPGFMWIISEGNQRDTQVNAGRAYARVQLAATAAGLAMQPLSQALQEYAEVAQPYAAIHRLLGASQPANTVQMWARVGYAPKVGPSPRRSLPSFIQGG